MQRTGTALWVTRPRLVIACSASPLPRRNPGAHMGSGSSKYMSYEDAAERLGPAEVLRLREAWQQLVTGNPAAQAGLPLRDDAEYATVPRSHFVRSVLGGRFPDALEVPPHPHPPTPTPTHPLPRGDTWYAAPDTLPPQMRMFFAFTGKSKESLSFGAAATHPPPPLPNRPIDPTLAEVCRLTCCASVLGLCLAVPACVSIGLFPPALQRTSCAAWRRSRRATRRCTQCFCSRCLM